MKLKFAKLFNKDLSPPDHSYTLLKKRPLDPIGIARVYNFKWKKAIYF